MQLMRTTTGVLHYRTSDLVSGRETVVFVNSLGTDFRIWDGVFDQLCGRFNIVLHDKAGHGLSQERTGRSTIADYARDLEELLVSLNLTGVVVCGVSVGGLIAQSLFQQRPDLVKAMVLSNTASKIGTQDSWNARISAVSASGIGAIADTILERWFAPDFRMNRSDEYVLYRTMLVRTPLSGYLACCEALRSADFTKDAARITVPVLCIAGEHDGSTPPAIVEEMARSIPGARYEHILGAGHLPCIECPELFAQHLSNFIATVGASSR